MLKDADQGILSGININILQINNKTPEMTLKFGVIMSLVA